MPSSTLRVAILTNIPAPYRQEFYRQLSARPDVSLTVFYLGPAHPKRRSWTVQPTGYDARVLETRVWELGEIAIHPVLAARRIRDVAPDVVVVCGWDQPAYWEVAFRLRPRPVLVGWIESHVASGRVRFGLSERVRAAFVRRMAAIVVPGAETACYLTSHLGVRRPILQLPNPVPAPPAQVAAAEVAGLNLLFVGALTERKDPLRALAIAHVMHTRGTPCTFSCAGAGPLSRAIAARARELGVPIRLLGHLEAEVLEAEWAAADCLLLPSTADPAPVVLSEAALRAVPFVVSDRCGGASSLLDLGAVGRVVPIDAADEVWAAAVSAVTAQPRHAVSELTPAASAARLAAFLHDFVGRVA